ncbi:transcriptional regulator, BadM/Rrf2 family [Ruminococcaceae bacterium FB2012]|nr:transcriptional regulator, BadM/Rrf2 family [Ruminococcaceae bacterium FB2012]
MQLTLEADYAVRIISVLCMEEGRADAKTISDKASVSLRFALKILRKLVSAELVDSFKGTQGGYVLKREPSEINLRQVIEAIEGTYYFSRCLSPEGECNRGMSGVCCYQRAFGEITELVRDRLDGYNFADLLAASRETERDALMLVEEKQN